IPDGACPGLRLVIQPSGSKSWCVRFRRPGGKPAKLTLGSADDSGREGENDPVIGGQARQRRPRYSRSAALSRSQEYPAHSTLYRAKSRQIQGFLARLAQPTNPERQQGNTWGSYSMGSV